MIDMLLGAELRQMRQKQDQSKRDLVEAQRSMSSIEAAAQRQYQADLNAAEALQKQKLGEWVSAYCIDPFNVLCAASRLNCQVVAPACISSAGFHLEVLG